MRTLAVEFGMWWLIPYFLVLFTVGIFILFRVKRHQDQGNLNRAWIWAAVGVALIAAHWIWPISLHHLGY